jgi:hypothetical protein
MDNPLISSSLFIRIMSSYKARVEGVEEVEGVKGLPFSTFHLVQLFNLRSAQRVPTLRPAQGRL